MTAMRKIGILGGVAWPSTIEYYRMICAGSVAHFRAQGVAPPLPTPPMVIESIVQHDARKLRAGPDDDDDAWAAFDAAYRAPLQRLHAAGCDFGIIANNTSHTRLHSIRRGLDLPLVSILDETARATAKAGAKRALVLGTGVIMQSPAYAEALAAQGVGANERLPGDRIAALQTLIDTEFETPGSAAGLAGILGLCRDFGGPDTAVLLACTELPLAFPAHLQDPVFEAEGFLFVNTTAVHARAALDIPLGLRPLPVSA